MRRTDETSRSVGGEAPHPAGGHFEPAGDFTFPFRHGSVTPITAAELARLRAGEGR